MKLRKLDNGTAQLALNAIAASTSSTWQIMGAPTVCANTTQRPTEALAETLALALHRHVPDWPGIFDEQLTAIVRDVLAEHPRLLAADS